MTQKNCRPLATRDGGNGSARYAGSTQPRGAINLHLMDVRYWKYDFPRKTVKMAARPFKTVLLDTVACAEWPKENANDQAKSSVTILNVITCVDLAQSGSRSTGKACVRAIAERKGNTMANNFTYFIAALNSQIAYDDNMRGQISKRNIDRWWDACEIAVKMDERIRALTTS